MDEFSINKFMDNKKKTAHDTSTFVKIQIHQTTHICKNQIHLTNHHPTVPAFELNLSR